MNERRPIAVDLFCGAGGMSVGFEQAGFDIALGVDLDGYHVAAHDRNFPHGHTLCKSLAELTADDVFARLHGRTEVDAVIGGPPCQGFSTMGTRDAADPRNDLVGHFVRIVREVRPKAFVMENVPGMLSGRTRGVLTSALDQFERAGYRITHPVRVLDASHFGVPQQRKRLIVLGLRDDMVGQIDYPTVGTLSRPTVAEAIADLPDVDNLEELFERNDTPYSMEPATKYTRVMRGIERESTDFGYKRTWDSARCTGCLRVRHTDAAVKLYEATPPGRMVPSHKLPRLAPDGIAPTLRAGSDSTHGSFTAPRPIHPFRPRCITAREAARLHGFPDWFAFYPLKWHAYRQIGNAVCPPVAKAVGTAVLKAIGVRPSRPRTSIVLGDQFFLPEDRPRSLKRIPQVIHYPPVIERLIAVRFDAARKRLTNPSFTFDEVRRAVSDTGVQLTWIRAETFLSEIARSRNVRTLLAPCLRRGFTIRRISGGDAIGEFVVAGHPEGIERKTTTRPLAATAPPKQGIRREQKSFIE
jgi:DNA (cytosine-5)-methyltransferase 1